MTYFDNIELDQFATDMERAEYRVYYESYLDLGNRDFYGPGVVSDADQLTTIKSATKINLSVLPLSDGRYFVRPRCIDEGDARLEGK